MCCLQTKLSNHDSFLLFYKAYFLRKWDQILRLLSFLLKMPKGPKFYCRTKLLLLAVRWEAEWNTCVWLSHVHVRLKMACRLQCCRLEKGTGTREVAGDIEGNSVPMAYSILGSGVGRCLLWSFLLFSSRTSVRCTATVHSLGHRLFF